MYITSALLRFSVGFFYPEESTSCSWLRFTKLEHNIDRGEAANHGITDVSVLLSHLLPLFAETPKTPDTNKLKTIIDAYEHEMMTRTGPAVLTSRRACLDAHDYKKITDKSPLVSKRAVIFEA